jgi:hypothetical protein
MMNRRQFQYANDHSKLRLQLFYLDELVQIASESLRMLDGQVDDNEIDMSSADLHQGTRAERSRSPIKESCESDTLINNPFTYGLDCINFRNRAGLDHDMQGSDQSPY